MSLFDKARNLATAVKAISRGELVHAGSPNVGAFWGWDDGHLDTEDVARTIGDGTKSDVLMTPVSWLQEAIIEAPMAVLDSDGEPIENHKLLSLLERPNPAYSSETLLEATTFSLALDGNAYWIKVRNQNGGLLELWYTPHFLIEPKWERGPGKPFIDHFEYRTGGVVQQLEVDDVLHFRKGVDPKNIRKGLSRLKSLLREVWTDDEAAKYSAQLLANGGHPGLIISPADKESSITPQEAEATKAKIRSEYSGAKRGSPLVMLAPTKIERLGFSPQELDLSPLRNVSEERVCARLGVVAAVVGFGSGLEQTKVGATMKELRQLSWYNGVIPMQRTIAGTLKALAQESGAGSVEFDNSDVEALRENQESKFSRLGRALHDGGITRAEYRMEAGYESLPEDEVYYLPLSTVEVPQGRAVEPEADPEGEPVPENGNGDGKVDNVTISSKVPEELRAAMEAITNAGSGGEPPGYVVTKYGVIADGVAHMSAEDHAALIDELEGKQHRHSATEYRIIENAPSASPPSQVRRYARRMDTIRRNAQGSLQDRVEAAFRSFGEQAYAVAREVLDVHEQVADSTPSERKQVYSPSAFQGLKQDDSIIAEILDSLDMVAFQRSLTDAFEQGFLEVSADVSDAIGATFGIEFELDDAAQQEVLREAGTQAGLIDLDAQTRDALFDAIADGRAEGLAGDNLARHIRDYVEAGPWRDAATRARVIARTEGAHAANVATIQSARSMPDTEHMMISDNRSGHDDEACMAADGRIVTIDEAESMGLCHPNGTRSYTPINALLYEELVG